MEYMSMHMFTYRLTAGTVVSEVWPLLWPLTPDGWPVQAQEEQHNWCSPWLCSAHHQHRWATAGAGDCNARWDTCAEEATPWGLSFYAPYIYIKVNPIICLCRWRYTCLCLFAYVSLPLSLVEDFTQHWNGCQWTEPISLLQESCCGVQHGNWWTCYRIETVSKRKWENMEFNCLAEQLLSIPRHN